MVTVTLHDRGVCHCVQEGGVVTVTDDCVCVQEGAVVTVIDDRVCVCAGGGRGHSD